MCIIDIGHAPIKSLKTLPLAAQSLHTPAEPRTYGRALYIDADWRPAGVRQASPHLDVTETHECTAAEGRTVD